MTLSTLSEVTFGLEIGLNPSILLTRSKQEGDPPLTLVLFDSTQRNFLPEWKKLKNLTFLGENFQNQTKDGRPDPT